MSRLGFEFLSLLVLLLVGCDRHASDTPANEIPRLRIVSSVYPLADIVRQTAGDHVELEWFCENGHDPRDLRLSDDQKKKARAADLVLTSGFSDNWSGDTLTQRERSLRLIEPQTTAAGRLLPDNQGALWLDPRIARDMAELVRERLTTLDAKHEADYRRASERLVKEIDALDADYRAGLAPFRGRRFLSLRPTFSTMVERYDLEEVSPINTDPSHLTDADVRKLKETALTEGIELLAIDASLLPGVRRELQQRTGLRLLPLDPLGSSAPDGRSTWIRIMRYNLEQLVRELK
jgi:zinc transport system substrate-binding protein